MTISQDRKRQVFCSGVLRLVGYSLLLTALVNICFLLISPQSIPLWEFQTTGAVVEKTPIVLLGMVLVYYGKQSDRAPIEASILKGLSWLCLISAMLLVLMIPLNISNSLQIYKQNAAVNAQISQEDLIQQFKEQLNTANSQDEISAILQQQIQQKINIPDSANLQKLKTDILNNLSNSQFDLTIQTRGFKVVKNSLLLKQCLKLNLSALIASVLFSIVWESTGWARVKIIKN